MSFTCPVHLLTYLLTRIRVLSVEARVRLVAVDNRSRRQLVLLGLLSDADSGRLPGIEVSRQHVRHVTHFILEQRHWSVLSLTHGTWQSLGQNIDDSFVDRLCQPSYYPRRRRRDLAGGGVRFSAAFVCMCDFPHDSLKPDTARITKLDLEMFHHKSWKPIYFGVIRSKVKVTRHKKQCRRGFLYSCECWLLLVNLVFPTGTSAAWSVCHSGVELLVRAFFMHSHDGSVASDYDEENVIYDKRDYTQHRRRHGPYCTIRLGHIRILKGAFLRSYWKF